MMGYVCSNGHSVLGTRPVLVASASLDNVPIFILKQSYAGVLITLYPLFQFLSPVFTW